MTGPIIRLTSVITCSKDNSVESTVVKVVEDFKSIVLSEGQKSRGIDETKLESDPSTHIKSECSSTPRIFDLLQEEDQKNKYSPEKGGPFPRKKQVMCSEE